MNKLFKTSLIALLFLFPPLLNAQVLISLIFGEALNSDKIEFGLAGGMTRSYLNSIPGSKGMNTFDLGFYFHILMKKNSYLSTGVHVKSNVGATGMPTYPLGDADFDSVFYGGTLSKKIPVFYVPIMFHQRFNNRWYIELGPQLGLVYKAKDIFEIEKLEGDLNYTTVVQEQYKRIDVGMAGGVGYKFKQQIKSMAVGITYYYGLMDLSKVPEYKITPSAIYFYVKIPIGAKKAEEKRSAKAQK